MPAGKQRETKPLKETPADPKMAAVNPSAHEMVSTVMRETDPPANKDEIPAEEEERDSRRKDRKGPGVRPKDPVGMAAGVCLFGGEGGRPLLGALGLLEPGRGPRTRDPRRGAETTGRRSAGGDGR